MKLEGTFFNCKNCNCKKLVVYFFVDVSSLRGSDFSGAVFLDEGLLFLLFFAEQGHEGGFAEAFAEAELEDDAVACLLDLAVVGAEEGVVAAAGEDEVTPLSSKG